MKQPQGFLFFKIRRGLWLLLWYSVYALLLRPRLSLGLAAAAGVFALAYYVAQPPHLPPQPGAAGSAETAAEAGDAVSLPAIRGPVRDGNSVFNVSILTAMDEEALGAYSRHFLRAMREGRGDQRYSWKASPQLFGRIDLKPRFRSDAGVMCRRFTELTSYRGQAERYRGLACQRKGVGWCRLRPESAHSCSPGQPGGWDLFLNRWF